MTEHLNLVKVNVKVQHSVALCVTDRAGIRSRPQSKDRAHRLWPV